MTSTLPDVVQSNGAWPPVTCASWCPDGTGHGDQLFAEDQRCFSAPTEALIIEAGRRSIDAYLLRPRDGHTEMVVAVETLGDGGSCEVQLAQPGQVRELAARLTALVDAWEAE